MSDVLLLMLQNSIELMLGVSIILALQHTILKGHFSVVRVLWIILIVSGMMPVKPYIIKIMLPCEDSLLYVKGNESGSNTVSATMVGVMFTLWLVVAVTAFLVGIINHYRVLRTIKDAVYDGENVYLCSYKDIAFTCGFFCHKIIISSNITGAKREYILAHERQHIHGRDNIIKLLYFAVCCIYWFNPLLWLGRKYFDDCIELACDERVIRDCTGKNRVRYAVSMAEFFGVLDDNVCDSGFCDGKEGIAYRRVDNVLHRRRSTCNSMLVTLAAFAVLIFISFAGFKFSREIAKILYKADNKIRIVAHIADLDEAVYDDYEAGVSYMPAN